MFCLHLEPAYKFCESREGAPYPLVTILNKYQLTECVSQ